MLLRANAKINLTLNITGKLENGYHSLDMIMQSVSLADEVNVELSQGSTITLKVDAPEVPSDERNTAYKAAMLFLKESGIKRSVDISIKKNIPSQAGLAGGSADAAAVLVALNSLCGNAFSESRICEIGGQVGADVPFCILGGTHHATGTGTTLERVEDLPDCQILICKPYISVSTQAAYKMCDDFGVDVERKNSKNVIDGLKTGNLYTVSSNLYNKFDEVLDLAEVRSIRETMLLYGAMGALMSGSGPTVYGIFSPNDNDSLSMCKTRLEQKYDMVYIAKPEKTGCVIE